MLLKRTRTFVKESKSLVGLSADHVINLEACAAFGVDQLSLAIAANTLATVHLDVRLNTTCFFRRRIIIDLVTRGKPSISIFI